MKKNMVLSLTIFFWGYIILSSSGCISIANTPSSRFYMLHAASNGSVMQAFDIPANTVVGVGPVKIPFFLNRPQIVTLNEKNMATFAEFDRWGESLDIALARLINENFSRMLPQANIVIFPWNVFIPVRYQVIADVIQLDCRLDKDLVMVVQWSVVDLENKSILFTKRSDFRRPIDPHNYAGLVEALSTTGSFLSGEMAKAIAETANQQLATSR